MSPALAAQNAVCRRMSDSVNAAKRSLTYCLGRIPLAHFNNLSIRQNGSRMLPALIWENKRPKPGADVEGAIGMKYVFAPCNILKVSYSIVGFAAVSMINFITRRTWAYKHFSNQPVNLECLVFIAKDSVSVSIYRQLQKLRSPVPSPDGIINQCSANPAVIRNGVSVAALYWQPSFICGIALINHDGNLRSSLKWRERFRVSSLWVARLICTVQAWKSITGFGNVRGVQISNSGADGYVIADGVKFSPASP